jgi:hypothetical protein
MIMMSLAFASTLHVVLRPDARKHAEMARRMVPDLARISHNWRLGMRWWVLVRVNGPAMTIWKRPA